jgi:hypothetical protein
MAIKGIEPGQSATIHPLSRHLAVRLASTHRIDSPRQKTPSPIVHPTLATPF